MVSGKKQSTGICTRILTLCFTSQDLRYQGRTKADRVFNGSDPEQEPRLAGPVQDSPLGRNNNQSSPTVTLSSFPNDVSLPDGGISATSSGTMLPDGFAQASALEAEAPLSDALMESSPEVTRLTRLQEDDAQGQFMWNEQVASAFGAVVDRKSLYGPQLNPRMDLEQSLRRIKQESSYSGSLDGDAFEPLPF